jgi:hypothetical protein
MIRHPDGRVEEEPWPWGDSDALNPSITLPNQSNVKVPAIDRLP